MRERRWPLAGGAVLFVLTVGLLARVDGEVVPETPAPTPPGADAGAREWPPVGAWRPVANSPGGTRRDHTAVWTGACADDAPTRSCGEVILWGGRMVVGPRADGAAYHPATDSWRRIPAAPRAPLEWGTVPGAWTGAELVLWAAANADFKGQPAQAGPRGVAYDPVAEAWRILPEAPLEPRFGHTATWTGSEVIVWGGRRAGGRGHGEVLTDGAAYDPVADAWRMLPDAPLPGRRDHTAVWLPDTGRLVVWGGVGRQGGRWAPVLDGATYDPAADVWAPIPTPAVTVPQRASAWEPAATRLDAPERLAAVAPLADPGSGEPAVAVYEPVEERWALLPPGPLGARGGAHVGGGPWLIAWGGAVAGQAPAGEDAAAGGVYAQEAAAWMVAPPGREPAVGESATWTDAGLFTWGGGREGALWDLEALPGRARPATAPQTPGETRATELPGGHETGWRLQVPGGATEIEVRGVGAEVVVWLEARSLPGWRIRRLAPSAGDCGAVRCVYRFDPLPERLPGPVEVRLLNGSAETHALAVTPSR